MWRFERFFCFDLNRIENQYPNMDDTKYLSLLAAYYDEEGKVRVTRIGAGWVLAVLLLILSCLKGD